VEAEIKSDFPDVEVTFIECGFGTFKVFLDGKNIFGDSLCLEVSRAKAKSQK
jgi:hypothetical protein